MNDDDFLKRLRHDAGELRYEPEDPAVWTRLRAGVRERTRERMTLAGMLLSWIRPIAFTTAATIALACSVILISRPDPGAVFYLYAEPPVVVSASGWIAP